MPCKSILVVDDDANVRNSLAAILSQAGYRVVTAGIVCDAIDSLVSECFDLVLLDLKLPDMGGLALLSNLNFVYPKLPVMILTGYSTADYLEEAERCGARGYFLKPVDPALLLDCVREVLSESRALQNDTSIH
jgi:DNA-binding NtrC family response regulator